MTLLAIAILENQFKENSDEWDMIVSKAKKWVRQQKIENTRKQFIEFQLKKLV